MSEASNTIIDIEHLKKRYPGSKEYALKEVNISIHEGEFFGLLGPNGSGKTTLISIICGLIKASNGHITIAQKYTPAHMSAIKSMVGLVPQDIALYPTLTLLENLRYFGRLYGLKGAKLKHAIEECVHFTSLKDAAKRQIMKYSGGMKRRANLALGLIHKPKILFLDEPTVNVDPQSREMIFDIITQLNKSGTTVIYTTHYLEEAQQFCNKVAVIDLGEVICIDTPESLIQNNPGCKDLGEVFMHLTGKHLRD